MSDTLADLASWLPSEFLDRHDDKTNNRSLFPTDFPYEFASSSSTESESDDDDIAGFTRRFTRSVSLQERLKNPYPLDAKKRVFSGSPESTLNWTVSGPTEIRSTPATPFVQPEGNARDLIYAAAGQVARMKMRMNNINDDAYGSRSLLGAPRPLGPPPSYLHHHHPNCAIWRAENQEFIRQHQFLQRVAAGVNYGSGGRCGVGRPVGFRQSAWPPLPVENQHRQQHSNGFVVKPELGGAGFRTAVPKRECAGTGVFLPRRYSNDTTESKRKPACPPAQLPPKVAQSFNKNMDPIVTQAQQNINGGYGPQYEMVMADMMLGQQRRSKSHGGVPETAKEVVLPQEWTY